MNWTDYDIACDHEHNFVINFGENKELHLNKTAFMIIRR